MYELRNTSYISIKRTVILVQDTVMLANDKKHKDSKYSCI